MALHCQGTLPPSHHGRTDRPAIHDGRRQAAVGREAESSSTLVVQMDSHKCGCRWNIGSCGHNQTFFSQIPMATLRHHIQHLAQKTRHLFNFPVHQTAPKTMLWRPQTNASNGQLPPRGRGAQAKTCVSGALRASRGMVPSVCGLRKEGYPVTLAMARERVASCCRVCHNVDELPQGHVPPCCWQR